MSTLYFFRHAQASFGKENYDHLSELGFVQAKRLADYLIRNERFFDTIYIGPQARHRQTVEEYLSQCRRQGIDGFTVKELTDLAEYDFGGVLKTLIPILAAEDTSYNDDVARMFTDGNAFRRIFETAIMRWVDEDYPPTDELMTWPSFCSRVNQGIDKILDQDGQGRRVAVFTSGGPLAVAAQRALSLSDEMTMRLNWQVINCSMTRFKCTSEKIMLSSFNEHDWLRDGNDATLVTYR